MPPRLPSQEFNPIPPLIWAAVLIVAAMAGWFIISYLRRRLLGGSNAAADAGSFLDEMRALRAAGVLSDAEFSAARRAVVRAAERAPVTPPAVAETPDPAPQPAPTRAAIPARSTPAREKPIDALQAPPGFDLTGAPLPKPAAPP